MCVCETRRVEYPGPEGDSRCNDPSFGFVAVCKSSGYRRGLAFDGFVWVVGFK